MSIAKRPLGKTGVDTTILGYGSMALNKKHVDEALAGQLLNRVLDAGINFIDTAPDYGPSEDLIGKLISHRRSEFTLATKCGCRVPGQADHQEPAHLWTAERVMLNLETSLRRLKTDHIDVWQIHSGFIHEVKPSDVVPAMLKAKQQGKVRFVGYSTKGRHEGDQGKSMLESYIDWDVFDVLQVVYCPLARHVEQLMHDAAGRGRGLIVRGLTNVTEDEWLGYDRAKLDELRPPSQTKMQFLLRLGLTHPALNTSIPGTANLEHLNQNIAAAEAGPVEDDVYREALSRLTNAGVRAGG